MSRIGRLPVAVPNGVEVKISGTEVQVKGPKGEMKRLFPPLVSIDMNDNEIVITRKSEEPKFRSMHGTARALVQNMVTGVSTGFSKTLEIQGVGYRIEANEKNVILHVGYSHPVEVEPPVGIEFEVDTKARLLKITGYDKQIVGQTAADIRKIRPPEPYKGKGIRYQNEQVRRKAGKTAKGK